MKKTPFFLLFLSLNIVLGFTGCDKGEDPRLEAASQQVGDILDIFELKEEESYSLNLENQPYQLTIEKIEDNATTNCSLAYFGGSGIPETLRTYVTLKIDGPISQTIKVQSIKCGALAYRHIPAIEIADIKDIIGNNKNPNNSYYIQEFFNHFDKGTVFTLGENIYKLYLAKAHPHLFLLTDPDAPIHYKFIFILTKFENAL